MSPVQAAPAAAPTAPGAGEYKGTRGDMLGGRYRVVERLGKGSYGQVPLSKKYALAFDATCIICRMRGQVVKCVDTHATGPGAGAPTTVAVKVTNNTTWAQQAAACELELLQARAHGDMHSRIRSCAYPNAAVSAQRLHCADPDDKGGVVRLLGQFEHGAHTCLVFELLTCRRARVAICIPYAGICVSEYGRAHVDMHSRMPSYTYPYPNMPHDITFAVFSCPQAAARMAVCIRVCGLIHIRIRRTLRCAFTYLAMCMYKLTACCSLYDMLRLGRYFKGIPLNFVRSVGRQLLETLAFLGRPEVNIVHADLKPENIMLVHATMMQVIAAAYFVFDTYHFCTLLVGVLSVA